jgi:hypothetical protein
MGIRGLEIVIRVRNRNKGFNIAIKKVCGGRMMLYWPLDESLATKPFLSALQK